MTKRQVSVKAVVRTTETNIERQTVVGQSQSVSTSFPGYRFRLYCIAWQLLDDTSLAHREVDFAWLLLCAFRSKIR